MLNLTKLVVRKLEGKEPPKEDPSKTPKDEEDESDACTKPFLGHLEDLRKTILWCVIFLLAGLAVAFPLAPSIFWVLKLPLYQSGVNPEEFLIIDKVIGGFSMSMRVIFWSGLLFSAPLIVVVIGSFIFPGLKKKERQAITRASGMAVILFGAGVAMGYKVILPLGMKVMLRINEWIGASCKWIEAGDYVSFVTKLLIGFGLSFQLPVVIYILGSVGVINSRQLRDKRPYVIVGLLVLAMLMTPPDPLTQIMLAAPLAFLYECCIWAIFLKEKSRAKADTKED